MNSEHIQIGALREYLLQTLSGPKAEAIEERYFTDLAFFKELRAAEIDLICDYLDGRLNDHQHAQFEARYLRVNALRKLVEEVRERRIVVDRKARRRPLYLALAGTLACIAILGIVIFRRTVESGQPTSAEPAPPGISLILSPGVTKGSGTPTPVLTLKDLRQSVVLVAVLPGQLSSAAYTVRLFNVDIEGSRKNAWTAAGLLSTPHAEGQQVRIEVPSASIPPGDYILEVAAEDGHVQETYVFRVVPYQEQPRKNSE